jgi:hypothetical protein
MNYSEERFLLENRQKVFGSKRTPYTILGDILEICDDFLEMSDIICNFVLLNN